MDFRTPVAITAPSFSIEPLEEMLFVGSCFADSIGQRFLDEHFRATVNPYGTMYNPVSVLHTIERWLDEMADSLGKSSFGRLIVFITLGTNHVYRLKSTGEIVDNCQKRPQSLFSEEELSIDECAESLRQAVGRLQDALARMERPKSLQVIFTVSPIRYAKYGFHESQLSKATLLLAVDKVVRETPIAHYFPAYEIVLDELRDFQQIGISLTESGAMRPHASVSGLMLSSPESHYFSVGRIGEDQLADYARRRQMPIDKMRKFLTANL